MTSLFPPLGELGGVAVFDDAIDLLSYRRDTSVVRPGRADLAAQPVDAAEVATLVTRAAQAQVPVYVRGGGTMYAGGANPHAGGMVLDLSRMNHVIELDLARGIVVVEAGTRFAQLLDYLRPYGQTIGIVYVQGEKFEAGGMRRGRSGTTAIPYVESHMVVVATRREERGLTAKPRLHVEAEDVVPEAEGAVEVRDLQMRMPDVDSRIDAHSSRSVAPAAAHRQ